MQAATPQGTANGYVTSATPDDKPHSVTSSLRPAPGTAADVEAPPTPIALPGRPPVKAFPVHADVDDFAQVLVHMRAKYPKAPMLAIGFSMGSNVLVKYLGQYGQSPLNPLTGAVCAASGYDISECSTATAHACMHARTLCSTIHMRWTSGWQMALCWQVGRCIYLPSMACAGQGCPGQPPSRCRQVAASVTSTSMDSQAVAPYPCMSAPVRAQSRARRR